MVVKAKGGKNMFEIFKKLFSKKQKIKLEKPVLAFIAEDEEEKKKFFSGVLSGRQILALRKYFSMVAPDLWQEITLCLPENLQLEKCDILSALNDFEICFSCSEDRLSQIADVEETYELYYNFSTEYEEIYCELWEMSGDDEKPNYYNLAYAKSCADKHNPKIVRYIGKTTADGRLNHGRCYVFEEEMDGKYVAFINNKGDYDVEEKEKFIYEEEK